VHYSSFIVRGLRWKKLLEVLKIKTKSLQVIEIVFLSWFANSIVPAKIGDIYRSHLLKKETGEPISKTIGTIVIERIFDIILLLVLLSSSGYLLYRKQIPEEIEHALKIGYILVLLLALCIIIIISFEKKMIHIIPNRFQSHLKNLSQGLFKPVSDFETISYVFTTSLAIWLLESGRLLLVTRSLGIDIGIYAIIFVALASSLLTAIPLTPAGLGAVEFAIIYLLALNGVDTTLGTAVAFMDRLISYWGLLMSGTIVYITSKKT
jgi:hypothetical protein